SNQFRAEYGHSSGGQFNTIVKTGGNDLHFELYEYFRNRNLDAVDQLFRNSAQPNPRYDQNRLGANIGGPIRKNKWFIFGGFEYNPVGRASASGAIYAPTAAGYSLLAANAAVSQTNLNVLKSYAVASAPTAGAPAVTVGGVSIPVGAIPVVGPNFTN